MALLMGAALLVVLVFVVTLRRKVHQKTRELLSKNNQLKQALLDAEANERKFRNLFEYAPVGNSLTHLDGHLQVNRAFCAMLGYACDELSRYTWQKITHGDDIALTHEKFGLLIEGKADSLRYEKRYLHINGSTIWADVALYLHRDSAGNPEYFIHAFQTLPCVNKPKKH